MFLLCDAFFNFLSGKLGFYRHSFNLSMLSSSMQIK
nr:MAG TPA_asm: hypothetical protein [Caudoviricetes sp.]